MGYLYTKPTRIRDKTALGAVEQSQISPSIDAPLVFFRRKTSLQGQMVNWSRKICPPREMKIKHPVNILVFAVIPSDDHVIPAFIFSHAITLDTVACIKC